MTITELISRIEQVTGREAKHSGNGSYSCCCPAHEDRRASLSVTETDGKLLLHCHAGCETEGITQALGLTMADLFDDRDQGPAPRQRRKPTKTDPPKPSRKPDYVYIDREGEPVHGTLREAGKRFVQARADAASPTGWFYGLGDIEPVLYRLPDVLQAVADGRTIYVCEGEKDCDNLHALGLTATTNPMGACKWRKQYSEQLRGADVVILPDHDEPGEKHAAQVATALHGVADRVRVLLLPELPEKGDVSDWLEAGGTIEQLAALAADVTEYTPAPEPDDDQGREPLLSFRATDAGNGEALAHLYGADLRFDWLRERWLRWTGTLWEPATMGHLAYLAKETARQRYTAAGRADNTALRKWAFASEARGRVESGIFFARGEYPISDDGDGWDADPDLLGTPNCIVDLTTGTARPGTRADRVTMKTSVAFDPSAEAPRWTRFLDEVFGGDGEMIDFVQRAVGYSLTGHISEQVFFLLNGRGSNGKSLLIEVLDAVLGDYGHTAPFKVFDYAQRTDHAQELAQFEGRRFVIAAESVENARLNEERLKALSGSGTIRANLMRQNSREFPNTVKLWLATNHRPRVLDDTDAFWRRARLIPFGTRFVDDDVLEADPELRDDQTVLPCDKHLKAKLMDEAAGILRWCVAGAARWHEDGLRVPDRVKQASTAWRDEADELGEFMGACCELGAARRVFADDIYRVYFRWAAIQGLREREVLSRTAFGRRLGHRFDRRRVLIDDRRGMVYFGVGLSDYGDELLELQH